MVRLHKKLNRITVSGKLVKQRTIWDQSGHAFRNLSAPRQIKAVAFKDYGWQLITFIRIAKKRNHFAWSTSVDGTLIVSNPVLVKIKLWLEGAYQAGGVWRQRS